MMPHGTSGARADHRAAGQPPNTVARQAAVAQQARLRQRAKGGAASAVAASSASAGTTHTQW